jgi:hypothetical protein
MKKKIIEVIVAVLSILLGMLLGKLLDWDYFALTREFSIIDALSLVTTVIIAIYITTILEKDVRDKNTRKDLFVSEISELESTLRSIGMLFEENDISYKRVNGRILTCRNRIDILFHHITSILVRVNHPEVEKFIQLITGQLDALNQLLIKTLVDHTEQTNITPHEGIVSYSTETTDEIRIAINDVAGGLFRLKIWVNNL